MELNYTVRTADGAEYGPVNLEQFTGWIQSGRVIPTTEVRRSDMTGWQRADTFAELRMLLPTLVAPPVPNRPQVMVDHALLAQFRGGASWLYWIAGLSLINSFAAFFGANFHFIFGLGITQVLDGVGLELGGSAKAVILVLDILVASVFVLLGIFAHRGHPWAFIVGLILFGIDTLLLLAFQDWLGVALHAFVLFQLYRGLSAAKQLKHALGPV